MMTSYFVKIKDKEATFIGGDLEMGELEEKVIDIVCKQLNVDKSKVTLQTSFINDLNADSLDLVELVMALEDNFGVSIPDEEAEKIQTVGDALNYIKAKSVKQ
jgi:acyl carrier protein